MKIIILIILILSSSIVDGKIIISMLDLGIDKKNKTIKKYLLKSVNKTTNEHSTHLACLINSGKKKAYFFDYQLKNKKDLYQALKESIMNKVDYIFYPKSGKLQDEVEYKYLKLASNLGIKIIVTAGNDGINLKKEHRYPCNYQDIDNLFCISNNGNYANKGYNSINTKFSGNIKSCGLNNKTIEMMGTSQSAAIYLKNLINIDIYNK